jgi:hypothetical protein
VAPECYDNTSHAPDGWILGEHDVNCNAPGTRNYVETASYALFWNHFFCAGLITTTTYDRNRARGFDNGVLRGVTEWSKSGGCTGFLSFHIVLVRTLNWDLMSAKRESVRSQGGRGLAFTSIALAALGLVLSVIEPTVALLLAVVGGILGGLSVRSSDSRTRRLAIVGLTLSVAVAIAIVVLVIVSSGSSSGVTIPSAIPP